MTSCEMLRTVVDAGRHRVRRRSVPNYLVAGKTGTARIAHGGSYQNRYISLFVGIVPASDPRWSAWSSSTIRRGGTGRPVLRWLVAAPVFSKVMDGALRLLDVPPDNVQHWYAGRPGRKPRARTVAAPRPTATMATPRKRCRERRAAHAWRSARRHRCTATDRDARATSSCAA